MECSYRLTFGNGKTLLKYCDS